jgi:hypothetical protein
MRVDGASLQNLLQSGQKIGEFGQNGFDRGGLRLYTAL